MTAIAKAGNAEPTYPSGHVKVWDLFVRLFHWMLAAAAAVATLTGYLLDASWITIHIWAGTAMAALVVERIVWGFSGGSYARFSTFVPRPRQLLEHLADIISGNQGRHLGHNPLGSLMILTLIGTVLALAISGALALGGMFKIGPFAYGTDYATGHIARAIHSLAASGFVVLIILHFGGAVFESLRTRENLVRAMVTGHKEARFGDHAVSYHTARPMLALAFGTVLAGGGVWIFAGMAAHPAAGVPVAPLDASYVEECGACHSAPHPSLLPAAAWRGLFANLGDHFGEDASLSKATAKALEAYVTANAAENYDTLAANAFRRTDPAEPYRITANGYWVWRHRGIADAVFRSRAVGSHTNCDACHADAETGRFDPRRVSIPAEAFQ